MTQSDTTESNTADADNAEATDLSKEKTNETPEKESEAVASQPQTRRKTAPRRGSRSKPRDTKPEPISDIDSKDLITANDLEQKSLEDLNIILLDLKKVF